MPAPRRRTAARFAACLLPAFLPGLTAHAVAQEDPLQIVWNWAADPDATRPRNQGFDQALADLDLRKPETLIRPGLALRLYAQLDQVDPELRAKLAPFLAEHEELAAEVASLLLPEDKIASAYAVLDRLIDAHGGKVADLAPLAAAICVVHDQPRDRRVNENTVPIIDPVELFGYYAANERAMVIDLRESPGSALVHLADAAGSLEEYNWARGRYGRDRNIGNRYQEITYDTRAFKQDDITKKVTESGEYTLQNIRKLGGVCADQAYYALSVGKAIGVPACYVVGTGGEVSHAWVGFVELKGRGSFQWNFDEGRYEAYQDTRGSVLDPQTWQSVPDAFLSIESYASSTTREKRLISVALLDAAGYVGFKYWKEGQEDSNPEVRAQQLQLLEASLRANPGNLESWLYARKLLTMPSSTIEQKEHWTETVDQIAGQLYPDFSFEFVKPIFEAEANLTARFNFWDWAAKRFSRRKDLAARARLAQTQIMIDQGRKPDAVVAARAVFDQYGDIEGLFLAERLLKELGRSDELVKMYGDAFRRIRQPRMAANFLRQTSWYQVGSRYAEVLTAAGELGQASNIRRRLNP